MIVQNELRLINVPFIQCLYNWPILINMPHFSSFYIKTLQQMRNKEKGKHLYLFGQIESKTLFTI